MLGWKQLPWETSQGVQALSCMSAGTQRTRAIAWHRCRCKLCMVQSGRWDGAVSAAGAFDACMMLMQGSGYGVPVDGQMPAARCCHWVAAAVSSGSAGSMKTKDTSYMQVRLNGSATLPAWHGGVCMYPAMHVLMQHACASQTYLFSTNAPQHTPHSQPQTLEGVNACFCSWVRR